MKSWLNQIAELGRTLRQFLPYIAGGRLLLLAVLASSLFVMVFEGIGVGLHVPLLNLLLGGENAAGAKDTGKARDDEPTEAETQAAFRKYAQCMRKNGYQMDDPQFGNGGGGPGGGLFRDINRNDPTFKKANDGMRPNFMAVSAYDGMHLIYEALKKTDGKTDGDSLIAAIKGMAWESPRGPISIDPQTRDIVQNIYIRKVEKKNGELYNIELVTYPAVKDPVKAAEQK